MPLRVPSGSPARFLPLPSPDSNPSGGRGGDGRTQGQEGTIRGKGGSPRAGRKRDGLRDLISSWRGK